MLNYTLDLRIRQVAFISNLTYNLCMEKTQVELETEFGKLFVSGPIDPIKDNMVHISIDGIYVFFLYYRKHRRAYVVSTKQNTIEKQILLPFCSQPFYLLYSVRGRMLDHLKNALFFLEKIHFKRIYKITNMHFFYFLLNLIIAKKNTNTNLLLLYDIYSLKGEFAHSRRLKEAQNKEKGALYGY